MLQPRQMIPPLTLHSTSGRTVRVWDFKQKKNLIIAFLHTDCPECAEFLRLLAKNAAAWRENDGIVLAVTLAQPSRGLSDSAGETVIVGSDSTGRGAIAYLGKDALGASDLIRPAVFLADRYGELAARWEVTRDHKFPDPAAIASTLLYAETSCDACASPIWYI